MAFSIHEAGLQRDGVNLRQQQATVSAHSSIRYCSQELPNYIKDALVGLGWQAGRGSIATWGY